MNERSYQGIGPNTVPEDYWWQYDSLHSLDYDMEFSFMHRYLCRANCRVCYIDRNFQQHGSRLELEVPKEITAVDEQLWFKIFEYFGLVNTNDDLRWLRENHPDLFAWYQKHAHRFHFSMSDSAVIYQLRTLMDHIDLAGIRDISLSDTFVASTSVTDKLAQALETLAGKYLITKIKLIISDPAGPNQYVTQLLDRLKVSCPDLQAGLQHEFLEQDNLRFDLAGRYLHQNTHIYTHQGQVLQAHRESIHLYNRSWFFTCDDASRYDINPWYVMGNTFSPEVLMSQLLEAKIQRYRQNAAILASATSPGARPYLEYFQAVPALFNVNTSPTLIPTAMLDPNSMFAYKLQQNDGWRRVDQLLVKPVQPVVPLCSYK